ncbi:MAG: hypothetical protein CL946_06560 [Ectothiorhodospiraceae bacterium]|nr:hypothetical protein [Ectothiorhodospiraceae bacterium]
MAIRNNKLREWLRDAVVDVFIESGIPAEITESLENAELDLAMRHTLEPAPRLERLFRAEEPRAERRQSVPQQTALAFRAEDKLNRSAAGIRNVGEALEATSLTADAFANALLDSGDALGAFFGAGDVQGQQEALKSLLKSVANDFITAAQAEIAAGTALSLVKGIFTGGVSLAADTALLASAVVALEAAKGYIASLDSGGVVMGDQLIMAHDRETVIPFDKAPAFFAEAVNRGAGRGANTRTPYRPDRPQRTTGRVNIHVSNFNRAQDSLALRESKRVA